MRGQSRARISQCMIVKNEEENMERALSWGKGIVSEQIVVDTGSTDRTVEIAQQMGAKVYHFEWINDFAAAKNYALSKARYEWIAFLDADEYFPEEYARKLPEYVQKYQNTTCSGIQTGWVNLDANGNIESILSQIRIFKNLPVLRYEGKIHERLAFTDGRIMEALDAVTELFVFHTGYMESALGKKKGRNLLLIQEELKKNPDDYLMLGYLGKEYALVGENEQAEEAFRKALRHIPEERRYDYNGTTSEIALRLLMLLAALPEVEESKVLEIYEQSVQIWPEESDYDYTMAKYYVGRENFQRAGEHLKQALALLEQYGYRDKSIVLSAEISNAYELLAVCCYKCDDLPGCVNCATSMLKENPYMMGTLKVLLLAFQKDAILNGKGSESACEVADFLGKAFYDYQTLKDRIFVLKGAMEADYGDLIQVMRGLFTHEELEAVDQSLKG